MSETRKVGSVPMQITAQIPGGEPFPLARVHLDLVAGRTGAQGGPVYEIAADLAEIRQTIETIFAAEEQI